MACLQKINSDFLFGCGSSSQPMTAQLGKYSEAVLINASDILSFSAASPDAVTIQLKPATRGFSVAGVNNSIKVSIAKMGGETYPNAVSPSVIITFPSSRMSSTAEGQANVVMNSSLVIALKGSNGITVLGLGAPLVCTEFEGDSASSEFITVTYGVDEGQAGSTMYGSAPIEYAKWKVLAE